MDPKKLSQDKAQTWAFESADTLQWKTFNTVYQEQALWADNLRGTVSETAIFNIIHINTSRYLLDHHIFEQGMNMLIKQLLGCLALTIEIGSYTGDFSIGREAFKETFLRHKGMVSQSTVEIVRKNLMKRKKFSEKKKKNNNGNNNTNIRNRGSHHETRENGNQSNTNNFNNRNQGQRFCPTCRINYTGNHECRNN
jgi:hypothetical protein